MALPATWDQVKGQESSYAHRWRGSQQIQVIHLVWPVKVLPTCVPVAGSHKQIYSETDTFIMLVKIQI